MKYPYCGLLNNAEESDSLKGLTKISEQEKTRNRKKKVVNTIFLFLKALSAKLCQRNNAWGIPIDNTLLPNKSITSSNPRIPKSATEISFV